jgi:hypothetical protein
MSVTRLKRKTLRTRSQAARRRLMLKLQNFKPVIRNVDIEKIKEEFKLKKEKQG